MPTARHARPNTKAAPLPSEEALTATLRAAGCVFAEDEARLILGSGAAPAGIARMVDRRAAGEPLEHVLGWAEFCGMRITLNAGVFIPRRRTEFLVGQATALSRPGSVVLDLCCGSGAVGAALARAVPGIELHAADIEAAAVRCARANLSGVGQVYRSDLFRSLPASLRGRIDVLVANAPYVPTPAMGTMPREARLYEPPITLDGGPDGMAVHRRLAASASAWLAPGGSLLVESSERQAPSIAQLFGDHGLAARNVGSDDGETSVTSGTVPG